MNITARMFILLALVQMNISQCSNGCLSCKSDNTCILCDSTTGYYLDSATCLLDATGNCLFYEANTATGACLICFNGFYIGDNQKCVKIQDTIDFCEGYQSEGVCNDCQTGYVVEGSICKKLDDPIANCKRHDPSDLTKCLRCEDNFILGIGRESCFQDTELRNCTQFSFIECAECTNGTISHENAYLDNFSSLIQSSNVTLLNSLVYDYLFGSIDQVIVGECAPVNIPNCAEFEDASSCKVCEPNYYLTAARTCNIFPIAPLTNCQKYQNDQNCEICAQGFHRDNANKCVSNTDIEGCTNYDGSAKKTVCLECDGTFYLKNESCEERDNKEIDNCSLFSISADTCITCNATFVITDDKLACLPEVPDCKTYQSSSKSTQAHTCIACNDGFYKDGSECASGTQDECLTYQVDADVCTRCNPGFYLGENGCVTRTPVIEFCDLYEARIPNKCETCEPNAILLNLTKSCKAVVTSNPNCDKFSNFDTCIECKDEFELDENNICQSIDSTLNCLQRISGACTDCKDDFYLEGGLCKAIPKNVLNDCENVDQSATEKNACLNCADDKLPYVTTNLSLCRDTTEFNLTTIDDCMRYDQDTSNNVTCLKCSGTKAVSADGSNCVDVCPENEVAVIGNLSYSGEDTAASASINAFKKCKAIPENSNLENCKVAAQIINGGKDDDLACIECATGMIPVNVCPIDLAYFSADNEGATDLLSSDVVLSCINNPDARFGTDENTNIDNNCLLYKSYAGNKYMCTSCKFGSSGKIIKSTPANYVDCSGSVPGCDNQAKFEGSLINSSWVQQMFGFNIPYMYSCHKCTNAAQIPFLHIEFNANVKLSPYDLTNDIPMQNDSGTEPLVACRAPDANGLNMNDQQFTSFPDNCALGLLNTNRTKSASKTIVTSSAVCVACKNGFKPVFDASGYLISDCVAIDNCDTTSDTSGWFDGCKVCSAGFAHEYNKNTGLINFASCVTSPVANCMAYDNVDAVCVECKKNYVFIDDKTCDAVKPQNCTNFGVLNKNSFNRALHINDISKAYWILSDEGCDACSSGINIRTRETLETCITSPYLAANEFPTENTPFNSNCISYFLDGQQLLCRTCATGFIPTNDNRTCVSQSNLANCKIAASDGNSCFICDDTHAKVGNTCTEKTIANCIDYSNTLTALTCLVCDDTFVLKNNLCETGNINNCKLYILDSDNNPKCTSCLDGNVLITPDGAGQQCMPIPSDLNCQRAELAANNSELSCTVCSAGNGFTTLAADFNLNTCVNADVIDNCAKYDIQEVLNQSTFGCTECNTEFYLDSGKCVERTILTGCAKYNPTANICDECSPSYLFNDDNVCELLKVGILNCSLYADDTTCLDCFSKFYLENNACPAVPEENLYDDCIKWSSATDCVECADTFYLATPQSCVASEAQNCLTNQDEKNCSSCVLGWYLETDPSQGVTSCVKSTIDQCNIFVPNENRCSECSGDFVANDVGDCIQVTTIIPDCKVYDNLTQNCKICDPQFILTTDGKSCVSASGLVSFSSCSQMKYRLEPVCTACSPGFYFVDGSCTSCEEEVGYGRGCLYCDYAQTDRCLICRSSYFMNAEGKCLFNQALRTTIINQIESSSSTFIPTSIFALMSILLLIFK